LAGAVLGGGGVERGDPVEDELPEPLVAPELAAPELAVAGLAALWLGRRVSI